MEFESRFKFRNINNYFVLDIGGLLIILIIFQIMKNKLFKGIVY